MSALARWLAGAALAILSLQPLGARADDSSDKDQCIERHASAQKLRRAGQLRAARDRLAECADTRCPAVISSECAAWREEVDVEVPSVLVDVVGADGRRTAAARVTIDGVAAADRLTGLPLPVDPGGHTLVVTLPDGQTRSESIVSNIGERSRPVTFSFRTPAAGTAPLASPPANATTKPAPASRLIPVATWVFGGVALLAAGSTTYFGVRAAARGDELQGSCAPGCTTDDAREVRQLALVADVSLGVVVLSAGAAVFFWLTRGESPRPSPRAAAGPAPLTFRF